MFSNKHINPNWIILLTCSCILTILLPQCIKPWRSFSHYTTPPKPDYSNENSWTALPTKIDSADAIITGSGMIDGQANAKVDVFFIHPTTDFHGTNWNADINDKGINRLTDIYPIRMQASAFNASCKVYAPRYRQATYASFLDGKGNGYEALDTAYTDIKLAFEYYLKNYNHGRPMIIAGHSQGAYMAQRILHDFFDNDPKMKKLLVSAYLIGGVVSENTFTTLVPCDSSSQTDCYVAWHSRKYGTNYNKPTKNKVCAPGFQNCTSYVCVNPLTWKRDTAYAPASLNLGSVPKTFDRIDKGMIDAKISPTKIIWTHAPNAEGYLKGDNYHIMDYSLYYMNIRENVTLRCEEYLKKNPL